MILINIESGKQFEVFLSEYLRIGGDPKMTALFSTAHQKLYTMAIGDILTTATDKMHKRISATPNKSSVSSRIEINQKPLSQRLGPSVAIYDIDSTEPYKIISLILSDALREEVFSLGDFKVVNREDINIILDEIAFQKSGIVDEKDAVQVGKALAAHQIIVSKLGALGKNLILQAKRIDVQTMQTLALASTECERGREEELLKKMPKLAEDLMTNRF